MKIFVLVSLFVAQVFAATTHHPHVTHPHRTHATREPAVIESFSFRYDPHAHVMAAITHHHCYIYSMSATESTEVHTTHGLHTLETKLITMVDDTTMTYKTMTHDEVHALSAMFAKTCNHAGWTTLKLN